MVITWLLVCENMQLMPGGLGRYKHKGQIVSRAVTDVTDAKGLMSFQATGPSNITDRLVGLVVKVSASRSEDSVFDSRLRRGDFFRVESYQ